MSQSSSISPTQKSFSNARVQLANQSQPIESAVTFREDGFVWVEAKEKLYPPNQIFSIRPKKA